MATQSVVIVAWYLQDVSFSFQEWPLEHKPKMPFGQVPVLEVDGKMLTQSGAICEHHCFAVRWTEAPT